MAGISLEICKKAPFRMAGSGIGGYDTPKLHHRFAEPDKSGPCGPSGNKSNFGKTRLRGWKTSKSAADETAFSVWSRGTFKTMTKEAKRVEHA